MKILIILLLFSATVLAQNSSDLRQKFGMQVSESFLIRSEALVTVDYAESGDREIVSMLIRIKVSEIPKGNKAKFLVSAMDKIVDEIVPIEARGKVEWDELITPLADPVFVNDGWVISRSYEKLNITYDMDGKEGIYKVNIWWNEMKPR